MGEGEALNKLGGGARLSVALRISRGRCGAVVSLIRGPPGVVGQQVRVIARHIPDDA